jgi:WD40 repeat protein
MEGTVDSADIIRLILGYLTAQGLHASADLLRQESGIGLRGLINPSLPVQVRQGDWGTVLNALHLSQQPYPLLHEQVLLELAETDETLPLAYGVLKVAREDLDQLEEDDELMDDHTKTRLSKARSLEHRLAALSGNPQKYSTANGHGPERMRLIYGSVNKQTRRNQLADVLQNEKPIPLNRLPTLLQQAMKWQSFTGQLPLSKDNKEQQQQQLVSSLGNSSSSSNLTAAPKRRKKRKHLDLAMGTYAGDDATRVVGEADDDDDDYDTEAIPTDILQTVKFGKVATCEAAQFLNQGLITASSDGLIEVWDSSSTGTATLNTKEYPYQDDSAMGHDDDAAVLALAVSNDQRILASGDVTGKVKVWNLATGQCLRQYQAHHEAVTCLALARDASRVLTASASGTCREFGMVSQNVLQEYTGHASYIHSCHYAHDGTFVVTSSADGTVRLWQHGQCRRIFQPPHDRSAPSILVDPTGIQTESPAIHTAIPIPNSNHLLVVPRSSTAYLVDFEGTVVQRYPAETPDSIFCAACVSHSWVYLCTATNHCLVYSLAKGTLHTTIRDFGTDSTSKTTGVTAAELTHVFHHPFKPLLAAFSNDKTQKKGVLTVWK